MRFPLLYPPTYIHPLTPATGGGVRRYLGAHYHAALITNSRNSLCGGASRAIRNIRSIEFPTGSVNHQSVNVAANSLLLNFCGSAI